ncbi:MAG: hypothetical protein ACSLFR_15820 [Solirubrobacteraceae bacterium]
MRHDADAARVRALARDLGDVRAMREYGLIKPTRLLELFVAVEPDLYRFPAIDPPAFRARVENFAGGGDR